MALGSCYTCIKYLMFTFNFLFWLVGIALLAVGIWVKVSHQSFSDVAGNANSSEINELVAQLKVTISSEYVYIVLIVISVLIMFIGFLGCCGAVKENQCLLGTFFFCLLIIFSVIIGVGIFAYTSDGKPKAMVSKMLRKQMEDTLKGNEKAQNFMKFIQHRFDCCGADKGVADYTAAVNSTNCLEKNFEKPCTESVLKMVKDNEKMIGGILIGISFLMLMGLVFSLLLCCAIKEQNI